MKTLIIIIVLVLAGLLIWQFAGNDMNENNLTNGDMLRSGDGVAVSTSTITYYENVNGFYAEPAEATGASYPGVVMVHEWWGLNDNIRDMARNLAGQGYRVLAVDLHKGKVAATPEEARALTGAINQTEATANLKAAADYLRSRGSTKVASLGWCFGGGQSLQLATSGSDLDATVIYYGQLSTSTERLRNISWPVLGIFGATDTSIPVASVNAFESALTNLGIENEIHIYDGVGHAFANPSGANYAPTETQDAWDKTLTFLNKNLK